MARPSTALRRFAVVSVAGALAALAGLAAAGTASALVPPRPAARVAPAPLLPIQGPYVIILHPQGLVTTLFDGML